MKKLCLIGSIVSMFVSAAHAQTPPKVICNVTERPSATVAKSHNYRVEFAASTSSPVKREVLAFVSPQLNKFTVAIYALKLTDVSQILIEGYESSQNIFGSARANGRTEAANLSVGYMPSSSPDANTARVEVHCRLN